MNEFHDIDTAVDSSIDQCPGCACGRSPSHIILMWTSVSDPTWAERFLRSYPHLVWDDGIHKFKPSLHNKKIRIKGREAYACSLIILMCENCVIRTLKDEYKHGVPWIVCLDDTDAYQFRPTISRMVS